MRWRSVRHDNRKFLAPIPARHILLPAFLLNHPRHALQDRIARRVAAGEERAGIGRLLLAGGLAVIPPLEARFGPVAPRRRDRSPGRPAGGLGR